MCDGAARWVGGWGYGWVSTVGEGSTNKRYSAQASVECLSVKRQQVHRQMDHVLFL
jgi:hypothetical protein